MVSNSFTSPSFSRVPGLVDRLEELRDRPEKLRQIALLVVVAAAGALLLILPEPTGDPVTIAALSDDEADQSAAEDEAVEDADEGNWLGREEPQPEVGQAELGAADQAALFAGLAAAANGAELGLTPSSQDTTTSTSTTEPSTTAPPPTEAPATEATTTAAPAGDEVPADAGNGGGETADSSEELTADATADADAADAEATSASPTSDDDAEATDNAEAAADGAEAAEAEPAEVEPAAPSTSTTSTTAAPDNGYVDAGHGVLVPPILLKIRFCESTDNYSAANPASSARGAYQFLTGSWKAYGHADRYGVTQAHLASPAQQDEAALITWQADGTRPWLASKHCWG